MNKRVVITGAGILTCNAKGREEFYKALKEGKHGFRPVTLFDSDQYKFNIAGEISDFDPAVYMGQKGLRLLDRSTKLLVSASKLAVKDAGITIDDSNTEDIGVSVGTTLGSIKSISDFDKVTLTEGPRYTNPALFPNTVINSPASQVSIWNYIKGFNTTISTGFTAAIDAMIYGYDFIQMERARLVFTGTVEEMCEQTFCGFHVLKYLSGSKDGEDYISCPFDSRRNGATLGEGAALIAFEELEYAKKRNANILAEVLGFGYYFDPFRINKFNPRGTGMIMAMKEALNNCGLKPGDIDCIFANANSTKAADKIECIAIKEVFGERAKSLPITAIKSMVGECYSATGAFATIAAMGTLKENFIPPIVGYKERDLDCDLNFVVGKSAAINAKHILINSFGPNGSNSCIILKRY